MTMGRPVADLDDFLEEAPPMLQAAPEPPPTHSIKPSRAPWIIGAAALLVAIAGVGYWFTTQADGAAAGPIDGVIDAAVGRGAQSAPAVPDGVAGFAELYVIAYLGGNEQDLATFLPAAPSVEAMTPGAHVVRHAVTVDSAIAGDDVWTVTVAADVLDLEDAGYVASGLAYFQVGVIDDGGRLVATALPSRVAAPPARSAAPRAFETPGSEPVAEVAALVGDFLEALLTERRDINQYVSSGSFIVAIRPAPYSAITVTALAVFTNGSTIATVDAQMPNGAINTLQYVLRIEHQGGDLFVTELMAGPPRLDGGDE